MTPHLAPIRFSQHPAGPPAPPSQAPANNALFIDRSRLVENHVGLVKAIAWRILRRLPTRVEIDELVSLGNIGLAEAAARYEPERGNAFSTYAFPRIRGSILDGLRKQRWFDEAAYEARQYETETDAQRPAPANMPDAQSVQLELRVALHKALGSLAPEAQELVRLTYFDGLSLAAAADRLGISRSWASRVHGQIIQRLRFALANTEASANSPKP